MPHCDVLAAVAGHGTDPLQFLAHGITGTPFILALAGVATAWFLYLKRPDIVPAVTARLGALHKLPLNKYYFDDFNEKVVAGGARRVGTGLWRFGDETVIDGGMVNGSARVVGWLAGVVRQVQSGYLYHYAFAMIIGLAAMLGWLLIRG